MSSETEDKGEDRFGEAATAMVRRVLERQKKLARFESNVVDRRLSYAFLTVPKAANTSVKIALLSTIHRRPDETLEGHPLSSLVHRQDLDLLPYERKAGIVRSPVDFAFTVVRNPWDRLVSCYKSKVDTDSFHGPFAHYGMYRGMPFATFVEWVATTEDARAEIHFRSQMAILTHRRRLLPSFVLRFEKLDRHWPLVQSYFCDTHTIDIPRLTVSNVSRNPSDDYQSYYDARTKDLVYKRYRSDVDVLGYDF